MSKSGVSSLQKKELCKLVLLIVLVCMINSRVLKSRADGSPKQVTFDVDAQGPSSPHQGCVLSLIPEEREPAWQTDHGKARLLQEAPTPRNMKILSYFPEAENVFGMNVAKLASNYEIAAHYYETIFKVFPFDPEQNTKFSGSCGRIAIPQEISDNGFDVANVDTVILNRIYAEKGGALAFAGPCQFIRRPVISQINFNAQVINSYLNNFESNYDWHRLVVLTMHEMGHIFGVLGWAYQDYWWISSEQDYFSRLYETPALDSRRLKNNEIIAQDVVGDSGREYMILPKVKEYADSIFQCDETVTGAKMQAGASHWDYGVWDRELMIPYLIGLDNRISPLTTNLYLETGWYAQVEVSASWDLARGMGEGCEFMKGKNTNSVGQTACDTDRNQYQCDIYSNFGGTCLSNGHVSRSGSRTCQFSDAKTRCFETDSDTSCVEALCTGEDPITVTLFDGANEALCQQGGASTVELSGLTYNCPDNYEIFCDHQTCEGWCNKGGVCVNGLCVNQESFCRETIEGCEFCSTANKEEMKCDQCLSGLTLTSNTCVSEACQINNCGLCSIGSDDLEICIECVSSSFELSIDRKGCVSPICLQNQPKCNDCDGNDDCDSCSFPWAWQAGSPASCVVPECSSVVTGCSQCSIDQSDSFVCSGCEGDRVLDDEGLCQFKPCSDLFPNCNDCLEEGDSLTACKACVYPWFLETETATCVVPVCSTIVEGCSQCSIGSSNNFICSECAGDRELASNGQCPFKQCSDVYENCNECSDNGDQLTCQGCSQPYTYQEDTSCKIECTIDNCQTCAVRESTLICTDCKGDWILSEDQCESPDTARCGDYINQCATCTFANGNLTCDTCNSDYQVAEAGEACQAGNLGPCDLMENCDECRVNSNGVAICDTCSARFAKKAGTCHACPDDCASCWAALDEFGEVFTKCGTCDQGFTKYQDKCFECDFENCDACKVVTDAEGALTTECKTCFTGFSTFDGGCSECEIENCSQNKCILRDSDANGVPETFCKTCDVDYAKFEGGCEYCVIDNCDVCIAKRKASGEIRTFCKTCSQGFTKVNGQCQETV